MSKIINLFDNKKTNNNYLLIKNGKVTSPDTINKCHFHMLIYKERMAKIKESLEKINQLMTEIKNIPKKGSNPNE